MMPLSTRKTYIWLTIFSIAMALLETAVVVYLRKLYYPNGFDFPLKLMEKDVLIVELLRELATLIMLLAVGIFSGRTRTEKFGMFLFAFAIWDIFYYVFLKIFLDWPASFFTWDILFLIPTTWTGPVLSPIIVSLSMILLAVFITIFTTRKYETFISPVEWLLLIVGSIVLIIGFTFDYSSYILKSYSLIDLISAVNQEEIYSYAIKYVPVQFPWWIFIIGQLTILIGVGLFYYRNRK